MRVVRKWAPWALLVFAAVAALTIGLQGSAGRPSLDAQVQHIASEVRCPVCNGETVAQSQAAPAVEIRVKIRSGLQAGESEGQILSSLVASYGPGILEKPQAQGVSLLVWVLPVIGVVLGAAGVLVALRRWKRSDAGVTDVPGPDPFDAILPEPVAVAVGSVSLRSAFTAPASSSPVSSPATPDAAGPVGFWTRRKKVIMSSAGVALVAAGASWAVVASSATRLPGEVITGQPLGAPAEAAALQAAQADENRNDPLGALKEYQKVLDTNPKQIEALSGEGWLLVQTGQPVLLRKGLSLLVEAEKTAPGYAPAHLYRGLGLLGEGDYSGSIPELEWYLDHNPDQQLAPQVRNALSAAKAKAAASSASNPAGPPGPSSSPATPGPG